MYAAAMTSQARRRGARPRAVKRRRAVYSAAVRARVVLAIVVVAAIAVALVLWSRRLVGRHAATPAAVTLEVRPLRTGPFGSATRDIDGATIVALRARADVAAVIPRVELAGPASGSVDVRGEAIRFEAGGFTDGIPADAVADTPALAARFVDPSPAAIGGACRPEDGARACPAPLARWYCDALDLRCHPRVPVIVSPDAVALYDTRLAPDHDLPPSDVIGLVPGAAVDGPIFTFLLGDSMLPGAEPAGRPHLVGAVIVGVSPHAKPIGLTVPLGHVRAWNRELTGKDARTFTTATVRLRSAGARAAFVAALEPLGLTTVGAP